MPEEGATNISSSAPISITFSEPMDPFTLTTATFTLTGPSGPVAGNVLLSGATATFTPLEPLAPLTDYTAVVQTARDMEGNPLDAGHTWWFTTAQAPLGLVTGDIEWDAGGCRQTLPGANSILVWFLTTAAADTFANLHDMTGAVTPVAFAFDAGGSGTNTLMCNQNLPPLEREGIAGSGAGLIKPWHIAGLTPGGTYEMSFTGGGWGLGTLRIFLDADGDGAIEATEVQDLIGPQYGVPETRAFGQPITADASGMIRGEFWGGSTNGAGHYGVWRAWTLIGAPR